MLLVLSSTPPTNCVETLSISHIHSEQPQTNNVTLKLHRSSDFKLITPKFTANKSAYVIESTLVPVLIQLSKAHSY